MRKVVVLCAAFALSIHAAAGFKAGGERWTKNRTVLMHLSLGGTLSLADGTTSFNEVAAQALTFWNQYLLHMQFSPLRASTLPSGDGDADNSVFFSGNIYGDPFGSRVLAVTLISSRGPIITETDVIFNGNESWDSYRGLQRGDAFDFRRVALHEFGHALGLDHPDEAGQSVAALMNSRVSSIDTLQPDDIDGARSIYDTGPAYLLANPSSNLVNLSTRGYIGLNADVLIGGFIVQGSQPANVVLRAIGNSLASRGVSGPNEDPIIELQDGSGRLLQENDDWVDGPAAETIASYRLDPSNSRESAIFATLAPGRYTVTVRGWNDTVGIGLVELYDVNTSPGRAGNISTRGQVTTGDRLLVAGFIVGGTKDVVLRALGPSLAASNVAGALPDPTLQVVNSSGVVIADNNNWRQDPNAAQIDSRGLAPKDDRESAVLLRAAPGTYTAVVRGAGGATGVGLVEVYDLSPSP